MSYTIPLALGRAGLQDKHSVTSPMILNLEKESAESNSGLFGNSQMQYPLSPGIHAGHFCP